MTIRGLIFQRKAGNEIIPLNLTILVWLLDFLAAVAEILPLWEKPKYPSAKMALATVVWST